MSFFKKHYEKLILASLLVVFILSLLFMLKIVKSGILDDIKATMPGNSYEQKDFKSEEFAVNDLIKKDIKWFSKVEQQKLSGEENSSNISKNGKVQLYNDFTNGAKVTFCPKCNLVEESDEDINTHGLIPLWYMKSAGGNRCPKCGAKLPDPMKQNKEKDRDGDGIPDFIEIKLGMDPNDPADASKDIDGDGFPTLFEYKMKTDSQNKESYPAAYNQLYVYSIKQQTLKFVLTSAYERAKGWFLNFKIYDKRSKVKQKEVIFFRDGKVSDNGEINDKAEVKLGASIFKILECEYIASRDENDKEIKVFRLTVESQSGQIIEIKKDQKNIPSGDKEVYMANVVARNVEKYSLNDEINVEVNKDDSTISKVYKYKITEIKSDISDIVILEDMGAKDNAGKKIIISTDPKFNNKISKRELRNGKKSSRKRSRRR